MGKDRNRNNQHNRQETIVVDEPTKTEVGEVEVISVDTVVGEDEIQVTKTEKGFEVEIKDEPKVEKAEVILTGDPNEVVTYRNGAGVLKRGKRKFVTILGYEIQD